MVTGGIRPITEVIGSVRFAVSRIGVEKVFKSLQELVVKTLATVAAVLLFLYFNYGWVQCILAAGMQISNSLSISKRSFGSDPVGSFFVTYLHISVF